MNVSLWGSCAGPHRRAINARTALLQGRVV
jgi:hypothetical protein